MSSCSSGFLPRLINLTALLITVSVVSPRKSNLTSPASSTSSFANCVTSSPFWPRQRGTYSQSGFSPMTTPAACMPVERVSPSSARAYSMMVLKIGFCSWIWVSLGSTSSARWMVAVPLDQVGDVARQLVHLGERHAHHPRDVLDR